MSTVRIPNHELDVIKEILEFAADKVVRGGAKVLDPMENEYSPEAILSAIDNLSEQVDDALERLAEAAEREEEDLPEYDNSRYVQFVEDMRAAGIPVRHYNGRWSYSGPAASTDDEFSLQDIMRATRVELTTDSLGLGHILYPQ